jgi:hypothetical protein
MGRNTIFQIFFLQYTLKFCVEYEKNSFIKWGIETKVRVIKG